MPAQPTDLILDVGNTRTKFALFVGDRAVRHGNAPNGDIAAVRSFLGPEPPQAIAMGSVAALDTGYFKALEAIAPVVVLTGSSKSPIKIAYATPHTLGADRLANVVGAMQHFPGRAVLAIDLGTCITYDVCDPDGSYAGGAIAPGLRMRAKAMHAYSAKLPLVDPDPSPTLIGTTTEGSMASGLHHGIVGEIEGFIRKVGKERPGLAVVLTGGDAPRFARALESGIFALPLLTLEGFHALLVHHRSQRTGYLAPAAPAGDGPGPTG